MASSASGASGRPALLTSGWLQRSRSRSRCGLLGPGATGRCPGCGDRAAQGALEMSPATGPLVPWSFREPLTRTFRSPLSRAKGLSSGPTMAHTVDRQFGSRFGSQIKTQAGRGFRSTPLPIFHKSPHFEAPKRQRRRSQVLVGVDFLLVGAIGLEPTTPTMSRMWSWLD